MIAFEAKYLCVSVNVITSQINLDIGLLSH